MLDDYEIQYLGRDRVSGKFPEVESLLTESSLGIDEGIQFFVVIKRGKRLIACAGLEENIVKCVAIDPESRGEGVGLRIISELMNFAYEKGQSHLFLYTEPENVSFFSGCGFHPIVEVPGRVTLLENTPVGIRGYCDRLRAIRRDGDTVGSIVLNANPFTLGHLHLIESAASRCDVLHLFVVAEDVSFFPYRERFELVREGIKGVENVTLHGGSKYMISKATFSSYFYKEKNVVGDSFTAVDLLIFRNHIAPALGVTHRFVGSEPFCKITGKYNTDMKQWLQAGFSTAPPIEVVEIGRKEHEGVPISASEVRRLLAAKDFDRIGRLVPATTLAHLEAKYS